MLIFGHTGITLGAAVLLNGALAKSHSLPTRVNGLREQPPLPPGIPASQNWSCGGIASWFTSLANHVDIRLLLVGSLLPDIIDKPVGIFFFRDTLGSGRTFCHTLLFLILITLGGLYLYWSRSKTGLLVLSFSTFTHLVLDRMWLSPRTLLWPLYGFSFEKSDLTYWMQDIFHALVTNPVVWISELAGATIVICFVWLLVYRGNLYAFLRNGQV